MYDKDKLKSEIMDILFINLDLSGAYFTILCNENSDKKNSFLIHNCKLNTFQFCGY